MYFANITQKILLLRFFKTLFSYENNFLLYYPYSTASWYQLFELFLALEFI